MGYLRNKGWPRTLRSLVLGALHTAMDEGLEDSFSPFELLMTLSEGVKKTTLSFGDEKSLVFIPSGPFKDGDYKLTVLDREGSEVLSLYIDIRNHSSRTAAEASLTGAIKARMRSILHHEEGPEVWKEFEDRPPGGGPRVP